MNKGDVLERPKGLIQHLGVYVGDGFVAHNNPSRGVHISTVTDFADGKPVKLRPSPSGTAEDLHSRLKHILSGQREYKLLSNNCEHTVSQLLGQPARSPQLLLWVAIGLLALFLIM